MADTTTEEKPVTNKAPRTRYVEPPVAPDFVMPKPTKRGVAVLVSGRDAQFNSQSLAFVLRIKDRSLKVFCPEAMANGNGGVIDGVRHVTDPLIKNPSFTADGVWDFLK